MTNYQFENIIKQLVVSIVKAEEYDRYEVLSHISEMPNKKLLAIIGDILRSYIKEYASYEIIKSFDNFNGNINVSITMIDNLEAILFTIVTHKISKKELKNSKTVYLSDIEVHNRLKRINSFLGNSEEVFIRNCIELVIVVAMSKVRPSWSKYAHYKVKNGNIKKILK